MSEPFMNDGGVPYGSRVLAITNPGAGAPVNYIADDINVTDPSKVATAGTELGAPRAQVAVSDFITGSATIQLETSSTLPPKKGATFAEDFFDESGAKTYFITEVGRAENANDITKVSIQFRRKYNA